MKKDYTLTKLLAAFIAVVLAIVFSIGCNPAKKLAKKREQAYQTVLTDSLLFRGIGLSFLRLQPPCANDTIIVDSTKVLILSDTTIIPGKDSHDTVTISHEWTNTIIKHIVDQKKVNELVDSINAMQLRLSYKDGVTLAIQLEQEQTAAMLKTQTSRANQNWWLFLGLLAAIIIILILYNLPKIKL